MVAPALSRGLLPVLCMVACSHPVEVTTLWTLPETVPHEFYGYVGGGLAVDLDGTVYAAAYWSAEVYRLEDGGGVTVLAMGELRWDGPPAGTLTFPADALATSGRLYVLDGDAIPPPLIAGPIMEEPSQPGLWVLAAGTLMPFSGVSAPGYVDGTATDARYAQPSGVCLDPNGLVVVADALNAAVRRVDEIGGVTTLAGGPGVLDAIGWRIPVDVACDDDGAIFVADAGAHRVWILEAGDATPTAFAGDGMPGFADGPARTARFNCPMGVALDRRGRVYVVDGANRALRRIGRNGEVSTLAGSPDDIGEPIDGEGGADGPARFYAPRDVEYDAANHRLLITDANLVRAVYGL